MSLVRTVVRRHSIGFTEGSQGSNQRAGAGSAYRIGTDLGTVGKEVLQNAHGEVSLVAADDQRRVNQSGC